MHPSCLRKWDRDSCQEPASKAPTGWRLHPCCLPFIEPLSWSCVLVSFTSYLPVAQPSVHLVFKPPSFSLRFPVLLDSRLSCQACLWCDRLVSGLVVCTYLLLPVSLGHCLSRNLSLTSKTLGSTWLSWSPALLSAQGLWTSCSWKVVMVRLVEPCLLGGFPRSLYLWLFIFNVASFPSRVLTFRK